MDFTISTPRCLIRAFEPRDIDRFMVYRNNPAWMKYQGFKGLSKQEYMDALLSCPSMDQGIQMAVISVRTDSLIGDIYLKREDAICWIGYTISPDNARQGYIREVIPAVITYLASLGITQIRASVALGNKASESLLKKLGFTLYSTGPDGHIYGFPINEAK